MFDAVRWKAINETIALRKQPIAAGLTASKNFDRTFFSP